MRAVARWRSLARTARRLTLIHAAVLTLAVLALRIVGVRALLRAATRRVGRTAATEAEIRAHLAASDRAARYVPGAACLSQALGLTWVLRGAGVPAEIRLGVRTRPGLAAHAWVERDGVALTGARDAAGGFTIVAGS
jgi:hypothetical protein